MEKQNADDVQDVKLGTVHDEEKDDEKIDIEIIEIDELSTPSSNSSQISHNVQAPLSCSSDPSTFVPRDATPEEISTLRHVVDSLPSSVWIVAFAGAAERFTYFAVITPWQNYMQNTRGFGAIPGALGLGQATATNISNAFFFFSYLAPMPFALVADTWLGRYWTLCISLAMYMCGCLIMFTTSLPTALHHGAGVGGLAASMLLIGLGVGGVKATFSPFLGDQYTRTKPQLKKLKSGELVVTDRTLTLQYIYNVFYWLTNVASLSSIASTFLEKIFDFWASYLLAAAALWIAVILLVVWGNRLSKPKPQGNILPMAGKSLACAARNGFKLDHARPSYQAEKYGKTVPWNDAFIAEMKRGLIACRVIFSFVIFYLCINQMYNNLISQAGSMELHGAPNDAIQALAGVACVILGPVIQALYHFLAKKKISFGPIARITVAFVTIGAGMAYAAGIQRLIYDTGPCFNKPLACTAALRRGIAVEGEDGKLHPAPNTVNVFLQTPVYFILGAGEIFGFVTASEYAYSKAPKNMKTVVQSLTQLSACIAAALGMAISPVAKDPDMVIYYGALAGVMGPAAALFAWRFWKYDRVDEELNRLALESETNWNTDQRWEGMEKDVERTAAVEKKDRTSAIGDMDNVAADSDKYDSDSSYKVRSRPPSRGA